MASFFTRQRIPAAALRVLHPRQEVPALLGYALVYVGLSACTAQLILQWPKPLFGSPDFLLDYWYFLFFKIGCLLVLPAIAFFQAGYRWWDLAPKGLSTRDYVWSVVAFAIGLGINSGQLHGIQQKIGSGAVDQVPLRILVVVLLALFNAGIPEEFFFRGWLQTRMEQRFGRLVAIVGTAVLFTAWHIPSRYFLAFGGEGRAGNLGSVVLNTGVPVLIVGLIVGVLWDRYRRLLPLIALHWGIDTLPLVASILGIER
jgi:membrane protease YdiL (CAAX protease family)